MTAPRHPFAARIIPPRAAEDTMEAAINVFATLSSSELAFDIVVDEAGASWWVRAEKAIALERALALVAAAYPGAEARPIAEGDYDPGAVRAWEESAACALRPIGDPALPLRGVWRDNLSRREADPLEGVVAHAAQSGPGRRVIARLRARAAGDGPREALQARSRDVVERRDEKRKESGDVPQRGPPAEPDQLPFWPTMIGLGLIAAGWPAWQLWHAAEPWHLAGVAGLSAGAGAGAGWARARLGGLFRFGTPLPPLPAEAIELKTSHPLLDAAIEVILVGSGNDARGALAAVAAGVAGAYEEFFGGGLTGGALAGKPAPADEAKRGEPDLLLNAREAAAFWHMPQRLGAEAGVERAHSVRLLPAPEQSRRGILVGHSDIDPDRAVRMPLSLAVRNQLIVAKTRRGKSTLLTHMARGVMETAVATRNDAQAPALVVLDPHRDLADDVLCAVPEALADRVTVLDFGDTDRPIGINLLDVQAFPRRDLAVENIVTVMSRIWPQSWGSRMEGGLRNSLRLLYAANQKVPRDQQYTLLDVTAVLAVAEFRSELLRQVDEAGLNAWWEENYNQMGRELQRAIALPVTSKIARFGESDAMKLFFGQPATTYNPAELVRDGGVLIISAPIGILGEGDAAMLGATAMNLVGLAIESQIDLPPEQRRPVISLVDESSTLGAINFERSLSELGKYGAGFVLVTQSLSKLNSINENLARVVKANVDGITSFQVAAEDARELVDEFGEEYLGIDDLVGLDDYHAYGRWMSDHRKPPPFSFQVMKPVAPDDRAVERALLIRARSAAAYGRDAAEVARIVDDAFDSHLGYLPGGAARGDREVRDAIRQTAGRGGGSAPGRRGRQSGPPPGQAGLPGLDPPAA